DLDQLAGRHVADDAEVRGRDLLERGTRRRQFRRRRNGARKGQREEERQGLGQRIEARQHLHAAILSQSGPPAKPPPVRRKRAWKAPVVRAATSAAVRSSSRASRSATSTTKAGSLRLPRYGTGAR